MTDTLICDTECYHGYWLVAFKRASDGKIVTMEKSDRSELDRGRLANIMRGNQIVTFNGGHYDLLMIYYAISGATNEQLKQLSDYIITSGKKSWEVSRQMDIVIPKINHIDLMEPNPSVRQSLKTLNGRMHGKRMQDLPIKPDAHLTHADMDALTAYCINDLDATHLLFDQIADALALRNQLTERYGIDMRSKSDAQIGETIIRIRVQEKTGRKPVRGEVPVGSTFRYEVPAFMKFSTPQLQAVLEIVRETEFRIQASGKVDMPKALNGLTITLGSSSYTMGIGGLHSTESNRAVHADEERSLIDADVASQYPRIIVTLGLFPKAIGPIFIPIYAGIIDERVAAKNVVTAIKKKPVSERTPEIERQLIDNTVKAEGGKIQANGVYGKSGSPWSFLYAPHMMIGTTLTGQLTLLMLAERAEESGISVVSGNTDGVVFHCPRGLEDKLFAICAQWEADTGFTLEFARYKSIYNASVNTYVAVKEDGSVKRKGTVSNPWGEGDKRAQLIKNPSATICSDAAVLFLTDGIPVEQTIRESRDIRGFVTVVNVTGGGTWKGEYLGKVVRYVWANFGQPILYLTPHPSTGNFKKVSKTDGCRPMMELPDEFPADIDYARYISEANNILVDLGAVAAPPTLAKVVTLTPRRALMGWALAA